MSPPQVNLSGKKEPDSTSEKSTTTTTVDKTVGDLGNEFMVDGFDLNTVIVDEAERRAQRHRKHNRHHRHRGKCIAGSVFVIILVVAAVIIIPFALRWRHHHRRHHEKFNCGQGMNEMNVDIDHDNHLIHAKQHKKSSPYAPLHIIHEYHRGLIVYKSEEKNVCFLDRLDETFEEGLLRWKSPKNMPLKDGKKLVVLSDKPIIKEVLEHICDVHIYEVCHNSNSMWVREFEEKDVEIENIKIVKL